MKLRLDDSLRRRLTKALTNILFDLIDGGLDAADQTSSLLRSLADEIDAQNVQPR